MARKRKDEHTNVDRRDSLRGGSRTSKSLKGRKLQQAKSGARFLEDHRKRFFLVVAIGKWNISTRTNWQMVRVFFVYTETFLRSFHGLTFPWAALRWYGSLYVLALEVGKHNTWCCKLFCAKKKENEWKRRKSQICPLTSHGHSEEDGKWVARTKWEREKTVSHGHTNGCTHACRQTDEPTARQIDLNHIDTYSCKNVLLGPSHGHTAW